MAQTVNDPLLLEACVRDELNVTAPRYCIALLVCEVPMQVCVSIPNKLHNP